MLTLPLTLAELHINANAFKALNPKADPVVSRGLFRPLARLVARLRLLVALRRTSFSCRFNRSPRVRWRYLLMCMHAGVCAF